MKFLLYILLWISIAYSAFASEDIISLREQVIGYNQGIIKAAKTSDVSHLSAFATETLLQKTLLWIKAYHDDNLFMEAIVNEIIFKDIAPHKKEKSAEVITHETWRYRYINIKDKKEVYPPTKVIYDVKYTFILLEERWVIKEITILSEQQEKL